MKISLLALGLSLLGSARAAAEDVVPSDLQREQDVVPSDLQRKLAVAYEDGCDSAAEEADRCCNVGRFTCDQANPTTSDLAVSKGSCNGENACQNTGKLAVGEYSCIGNTACRNAGGDYYHPHPDDDGSSSSSSNNKSTIGSNSCNGNSACKELGRNGFAIVGSNSCNGDFDGAKNEPCSFAGAAGGDVSIGDHSCSGPFSCKSAGNGGKSVSIGNGSCKDRKACFQAGQDANGNGNGSSDKEVTIGENSCNGDEACVLPNKSAFIGSGSCNCPFCCSCVPDGAFVPNNSCNSLGECCLENKSVNQDFDFSPIYGAAPEFDIALDSCEFTPDAVGSDIGDITCIFTASGGIDHTVSSAIYENDCVSDLAQTGIVQDATPSFDPVLVGATQETSTYRATVSLTNSAVPADSTYVAFCLKTEVRDSDGYVYDWIGQKIRLDINVDGTFSTDGLTTETFDGTTLNAADAGDASFGVGIKRCDSNGNDVADDTELSLGENFFLCVEGDQSAVVINSIREMMATKDGVTDLNIVSTVGDGSGEGDRNQNTFVYGYGSNKVVVATRLPSRFFADGGAVTLSGTANISTGGRRRLGRSMQAASSEKESADFSMNVTIAGSLGDSGVSAIKTTVAVFFGTVAASMLL